MWCLSFRSRCIVAHGFSVDEPRETNNINSASEDFFMARFSIREKGSLDMTVYPANPSSQYP